jgi:hypothetical protein
MPTYPIGYGGSAVPYAQQGQPGRQSTYGSGLGNIYTYGSAMPYGPYSFLPRAGGTTSPGYNPQGGGSTRGSTTTSTPSGAEGWLQNTMAGNNAPYSQTNTNAMMGRQANMSSAAESANLGQINANAAAGGASANDPSLRHSRQQVMDKRQQQNMGARQNIDAMAQQANFGAQMQAADILHRTQLQREGWANSNSNAAMSFLPWNRGGGYDNTEGNSDSNWYGMY